MGAAISAQMGTILTIGMDNVSRVIHHVKLVMVLTT
jgi:hypothetical protein